MKIRWATLILPLLTGCVGVRTLEGERIAAGSPAFRAYVERVFRQQNQVLDALAFRLAEPELGAARATPLEQAETDLIRECAALNTLAAARRDGRRLGRLESLRLARETPACEAATRAAERALNSVESADT